jgi:hypothetical protein
MALQFVFRLFKRKILKFLSTRDSPKTRFLGRGSDYAAGDEYVSSNEGDGLLDSITDGLKRFARSFVLFILSVPTPFNSCKEFTHYVIDGNVEDAYVDSAIVMKDIRKMTYGEIHVGSPYEEAESIILSYVKGSFVIVTKKHEIFPYSVTYESNRIKLDSYIRLGDIIVYAPVYIV